MRRSLFAASALALAFVVLPGCGGTDNSTSQIQESDAAKKANASIVDAAKGAMKSKEAGPAKPAAGVAPK